MDRISELGKSQKNEYLVRRSTLSGYHSLGLILQGDSVGFDNHLVSSSLHQEGIRLKLGTSATMILESVVQRFQLRCIVSKGCIAVCFDVKGLSVSS